MRPKQVSKHRTGRWTEDLWTASRADSSRPPLWLLWLYLLQVLGQVLHRHRAGRFPGR